LVRQHPASGVPESEPREIAVLVEPAVEPKVADRAREGKNYRTEGKTYTG